MKMKILANVLQAAGILAISGGIALYSVWVGIVTVGIGAVLFGVAIEMGNRPASEPPGPPAPPTWPYT